jgi:putative transposase
MYKAFKTELDPTHYQENHFRKCAGIARVAFNWGLDYCKNEHAKGNKYPGYFNIKKAFNNIKDEEFPFVNEVARDVTQESLNHLHLAYKNFFDSVSGNRKGKKVGVPKYKKGRDRRKFKYNSGITVYYNCIKLPRIGYVRLKEKGYIPTDVKVVNVSISEKAGRWFISALVDVPNRKGINRTEINKVIGIDLGINTLAAVSDGVSCTLYSNIRPSVQNEKRLKRANRSLSRKEKGSKNRLKAKLRLQKVHFDIFNQRTAYLQKVSTDIINTNPDLIVFETLKIQNMMKTNIAKSIADAGLNRLRTMIEYKARNLGIEIKYVSQWYPSSQTCSLCNSRNQVERDVKVFECINCGIVIDRDLNAAENIRNEGIRLFKSGT